MHQDVLRFCLHRFPPFLLCLALILSSLLPFHLLPYYPYRFEWALVPIFYFAIYNPKVLSSWAVFILGVIAELFVQSPFGVIPFCFVLLYFIANFLRKYLIEMTFFLLWVVFAGVLLGLQILEYLLCELLTENHLSFQPVLVHFWMITLTYPFFIRLCAWLDKKIREAA